jgi:lysosomal acid lipase/cholesteryl ester hydrolase
MQTNHVPWLEWTFAGQQCIGLLLALPFLVALALQSLYSWGKNSDAKSLELVLADRIGRAKDFAEICGIFGYMHEEHTVITRDGYILLLHRIVSGGGIEAATAQSEAPRRPVVFINHGLLTNSELYMAVSDPRKCLPLALFNAGYDVWLGNNRYYMLDCHGFYWTEL